VREGGEAGGKRKRMTKKSEHLRENRRKKDNVRSLQTSLLHPALFLFLFLLEVPYILPWGIRALPLHRTFAKKLFIGAVS